MNTSYQKNKELVRDGHDFAAAMSNDTPIIEIAKLVSRLASALDVQTVLVQQLAAENEARGKVTQTDNTAKSHEGSASAYKQKLVADFSMALENAARAATQGDWHGDDAFIGCNITCMVGGSNILLAKIESANARADMTFIALASPANVLALLDALEEAKYQRENIQRVNCGLFDKLVAAENRIASLEARTEQQSVSLRWRWSDGGEHWTYAAASKIPEFVAAGFTKNNGVEIEYLYTAPPAPAPVAVKLPEPLAFRPPSRRQVVFLDDVLAMLTAAGIKIVEGE